MPNSIDLPRAAANWTEVDRRLYNQLPFYLAKRQVEYCKWYGTWGRLLNNIPWTPNSGPIMKGVNKVKSPILRSQAFPNVITSLPKKDVIETRETSEQVQLYRQDFDTNVFQFLPSFEDFLRDHVESHEDDMMEKIEIFKDLFYRTSIFHGSPKVYVCGATTRVQDAPTWTSPTISEAKTTAYLQNIVTQATGALTLEHLKNLGTVMYNDLGVAFYSGNVMPDGSDGAGIKYKYCLIHGSEVWDGFTDTGSYLLANRYLDLDVVTGPFTGSLFGRWTGKCERFEMRIAADGTIPAPETIETNPAAYNYGEPVPNPAWVNAPVGVAFAVGADAYKIIRVGAPPSMFAEGVAPMNMKQFSGMDWSGKIIHTRNVLVKSLDQAGNVVSDTNARGEYLKLLADVVLGILPNQRRSIVPIFYRRSRIATS